MKVFVLFIVVFCGVVFGVNPEVITHTDISVPDANDLISSNKDLIIIDVRDFSEYCGGSGHVPGAYNFPRISGVSEKSYRDLLRTDKILVICWSGGRSDTAASFLDSKGYLHVYDMGGGTNAWKNTYKYTTVGCVDTDGDGINDDLDNCPSVYNPLQSDLDNDKIGNACEDDCPNFDELNPVNFSDFAIFAYNWQQSGSGLDGDFNSDDVVNIYDLVVFTYYWLSDCQE